jgi:hypothetical protein
MRYEDGLPVPQVGEVDEVLWVPLDEMAKRMTHLNERRLVGLVEKIVEEKSASDLGF